MVKDVNDPSYNALKLRKQAIGFADKFDIEMAVLKANFKRYFYQSGKISIAQITDEKERIREAIKDIFNEVLQRNGIHIRINLNRFDKNFPYRLYNSYKDNIALMRDIQYEVNTIKDQLKFYQTTKLSRLSVLELEEDLTLREMHINLINKLDKYIDQTQFEEIEEEINHKFNNIYIFTGRMIEQYAFKINRELALNESYFDKKIKYKHQYGLAAIKCAVALMVVSGLFISASWTGEMAVLIAILFSLIGSFTVITFGVSMTCFYIKAHGSEKNRISAEIIDQFPKGINAITDELVNIEQLVLSRINS